MMSVLPPERAFHEFEVSDEGRSIAAYLAERHTFLSVGNVPTLGVHNSSPWLYGYGPTGFELREDPASLPADSFGRPQRTPQVVSLSGEDFAAFLKKHNRAEPPGELLARITAAFTAQKACDARREAARKENLRFYILCGFGVALVIAWIVQLLLGW